MEEQLRAILLASSGVTTLAPAARINWGAHRMGWRVEWWIDLPFRLFGQRNHCRKAYYKDLERAAAFKAQHRERSKGK